MVDNPCRVGDPARVSRRFDEVFAFTIGTEPIWLRVTLSVKQRAAVMTSLDGRYTHHARKERETERQRKRDWIPKQNTRRNLVLVVAAVIVT